MFCVPNPSPNPNPSLTIFISLCPLAYNLTRPSALVITRPLSYFAYLFLILWYCQTPLVIFCIIVFFVLCCLCMLFVVCCVYVLFVLQCIFVLCYWVYVGCEAYSVKNSPRELRFYKSPEQGLNLSRSQDKPTLVLTIPRSISKSSTKDLSHLSARKATKFGVGPKPIATRKHRER